MAAAVKSVHSSPRLGCQLGHCLVPTLQALANALQVNKTVTKVNLTGNRIGDEGVKARAQRGPRLGGCGTVGLSRGDGDGCQALGCFVTWAIFLLQTAVLQRWCVKHDVLRAFLKVMHFARP